MDKTEIETKN